MTFVIADFRQFLQNWIGDLKWELGRQIGIGNYYQDSIKKSKCIWKI